MANVKRSCRNFTWDIGSDWPWRFENQWNDVKIVTLYLQKVVETGNPSARSPITALFNNTRTLKLKAQPTNAFFAAVNQVFGGSSQLTTTAELCSLSELCTTIWLPRARQQSKAGRSQRTFNWRERKTHLSIELWILESACYWKAQ